MANTNIIKLGLIGMPGAGKSTVRNIIERVCHERSIPTRLIKLATPLYEAQAFIYKLCKRELVDFYSQDGELLNFLGSHMRKINPAVLLDIFDERLAREEISLAESREKYALIICDDVRPQDAEQLIKSGFRLLRVVADPEECLRRRSKRNDLTLSSASHPTEEGMDGVPVSWTMANEGSFEELNTSVVSFIDNFVP